MTQARLFPPNVADQAERTGDIYGYHTLRVDRRTGMVLDGTTEVGYVGQTVQPIEDRDAQHRGIADPAKEQPFSDVIFGAMFVIEANVPVSKLDEREAYHIGRLLPTYNHQLQAKVNPNRIQISEARRHRDARDAAKGKVPRQWPALRNPPKWLKQTAPERPSRPPQRKPSRLPAKWRRRLYWAYGWAAAVVVLWVCVGLYALGRNWPWASIPVGCAGLTTAAYVFHLPRKRRATAWVLVAVVTLVLAGLVSQ